MSEVPLYGRNVRGYWPLEGDQDCACLTEETSACTRVVHLGRSTCHAISGRGAARPLNAQVPSLRRDRRGMCEGAFRSFRFFELPT